MIKKAVIPIIGIAVLALVGVIYMLKSGTPSLEQLVEGEYSLVYDTGVREALEDVFAQRPDELEWVWWDANFDGEDDLILQENTPSAEGMKRIQGLFCVSDNEIICVMWDDTDGTEFYSLCNNKLVYYSQYLGTYTQKVYEVCEYDCDWNKEAVSGLEIFYIENMTEMPADWTTEHPDMQAEGAYYQKFNVEENGEKVYTSLTVQEWCGEFEKLLGLPAPVVEEDENAYFYTTDYQYLTATVEYYELETRTEKEIVAEVYLVKEYKQGKVYKFAIEPVGYLGEERFNIYFYVTSDKIYRLYSYTYQDGETIEFYDNDELLVQYLDTDEKLVENGTIVCQSESTAELIDQNSIYSITADGNRVTYSRTDVNVNGERGFYEYFVWEEGKGLIEYGSGFGVEADILYLSQIEAVASTEVAIYNYDVSGAKLEDITYPQVCNMEDKELENKINESLAYVFTHFIATDLDRVSYFSDMPIIMFQNDEYLSVKTIVYYANPNVGGGRLISFPIYQTVSVRTGELLELDDFVEVSDEFVQFLLDSPEAIRSIKYDDIDEVWNETLDVEIRAYIKEENSAEEMLLYFEEANIEYNIENYLNKCAFYLTDGEINIVHDTGVVDLPKYFKIRLEVNDIEEYLKVPKWFGMKE